MGVTRRIRAYTHIRVYRLLLGIISFPFRISS